MTEVHKDIICPSCGSNRIRSNGLSVKSKQQYACKQCYRGFILNPRKIRGVENYEQPDSVKEAIRAGLLGGTVKRYEPIQVVQPIEPVAQPQSVSELVPTFKATIGGKVVEACDARAVHAFLQSGNRFSDWMVSRINEYNFKENQDFVILISELSEIKIRHGGDRRRTEYHITIRMAKKLGMVEHTERGNLVREYFLDMEDKALEAEKVARSGRTDKELTEDELDIQRAKHLVTLLEFRLETKSKIKQLQSVTESQTTQISEITTKLKEFDSETGYRTVLAYARDKNRILPVHVANHIGREAATMCRRQNLEIGKCSDERYGQVNSYPIFILEKVFMMDRS